MLCDLCHKNTATVHLTEIINGKIMELHICHECAHLRADEFKHQLNITEFLGEVTARESREDDSDSLCCPFCGINFDDFKKKGLLGCARCYTAFGHRLIAIIKKIHGTLYYRGKISPAVSEEVILDKKLADLRKRLERSVQIEAYEEAANIRDKIKELEKKIKLRGSKT